jgi:hypothetical protein
VEKLFDETSYVFFYFFYKQPINVYRDRLLQGFEIPALVFFGNNMDGNHNNKVVSRCISNLILVINEDVAKSLQLDENLSLTIPIYGLFWEEIIQNKSFINNVNLNINMCHNSKSILIHLKAKLSFFVIISQECPFSEAKKSS